MPVNRPTFKVSVKANSKATERKSIFVDIKPDTSLRIRVMPPVTESGSIYTRVTNHFKLKNDEGFGMALACLGSHGTPETGDDCYLCRLVRYLKSTNDKLDAKIADELRASPRWYIQALVYDKESNSYSGPKLVGVSKTTADAITSILGLQEDSGDDFFCDPDNGQDLVIRRTGSGMLSKYAVSPTGSKASLDDIFPGWEDKIITDVLSVMDLKVEDIDGQKRAAVRSFEGLDWEAIEEAIG